MFVLKIQVTYEFERKDIHGRELNFQTTLTPVIQNDEINILWQLILILPK